MVEKVKGFQVIKYQTSSGENCVATKNNGIVTISGDVNGVRQVPVGKFMQEFIIDQQKVNLERSPKGDTVSFSGKDLSEMKFGPAGFGPGHPKHEENDKKSKGWLWGTIAAIGAIAAYALTKGKAGGKVVAGLADDVAKAGSKATANVADDVAKSGAKVFNMADDVTKQGAKVVKVDKVSVPKNSAGFVDDAVDISRRGSYGQDIYDPFNPLNQDDFLSPYYRQKGSFGQNLDDMFDPMNKMDPLSPFYDSTGLGMF